MTEKKVYSHLEQIAKKIGLDHSTITKAQELYRLCSIKSNLDKITDIPKSVLCLDLAAKNLGATFNKDIALKCSTLSLPNYQRNYNLLEKSLNLQETLSIRELCVILNCSEAKELAETILCKYKECNVIHDDLNHPQYNTIAIFMACNLKKIKVTRKQFIQESHLKQTQWKQLELKFLEFIKQIGLDTNAKQSNKVEDSLDYDTQIQSSDSNKTEMKKAHDEIEDYETWKARILKEAYEALQQEQC